MSKKNKNSVTPVEAVPATPVVATSVANAEVAPVVLKRKGISRVFAFLTLLACVAVVIFLPLSSFKADWSIESKTLMETAKALFAKDNTVDKLFGFLPASLSGSDTTIMIANLLPYVLALCLGLAAILSLIALFAGKRGLVKAALVFILLGALLYVGGVYFVSNDKATAKFDLYASILAGGALLLFIIVCIATKKKVKEEPVVETVDPVAEMMKTFHTEEVIEAYAYEGGPVAGIEIAEEVYPTVAAIEAQKDPDGVARNTVASLLGNGFDAFLITLNEKEKNEFIDLYVLKCKGIMPEIPGYVVGGDNKDFFNKVFIYLGQYREKIPGDLLAKMYSFSMKI